MSIAPSERHLEDWIVTHNPFDMTLIARQLVVPSGIIDLLYRDGNGTLIIMELKKGPIDEKALGQILRYSADLETMLNYVATDLNDMRSITDDEHALTLAFLDRFKPFKWLVGYSGVAHGVMSAAESIDARVTKYELTENGYQFEINRDIGDEPYQPYLDNLANGIMHTALKDHVFGFIDDMTFNGATTASNRLSQKRWL